MIWPAHGDLVILYLKGEASSSDLRSLSAPVITDIQQLIFKVLPSVSEAVVLKLLDKFAHHCQPISLLFTNFNSRADRAFLTIMRMQVVDLFVVVVRMVMMVVLVLSVILVKVLAFLLG